MASELSIVEVEDGLRFTLTTPPSPRWARVFGTAALFTIGGIVLAWLTRASGVILPACYAVCFFALLSYSASRTHRVVLHAGNLEFRCGSASIARAAIDEFAWEYGERHKSAGLYASCRYSHTCIFPGLPEESSEEVVVAIYKRFPDTRGQDRFNPGAPDSLTLLRLNG